MEETAAGPRLPHRARAAAAARDHRRGAYQPGAGADRASCSATTSPSSIRAPPSRRSSAFPDVKVIAEWPDVALPPLGIDRYTAFVALTHDPKIDDPALTHALARDCFYIGALGSKKTHGAAARAAEGAGHLRRRRWRASMRRSGSTSARCRRPRSRSRSWARSRRGCDSRKRRAGAGEGIMKFGAVPVAEAEGGIAVHSIRKGGAGAQEGHRDRPGRDRGARRPPASPRSWWHGSSRATCRRMPRRPTIAAAVAGEGVRVDRAFTGRANLFAETAGVLVVDKDAIDRLNRVDEVDHLRDAAGLQAGGRRRDDRDREDHSVCGRQAALRDAALVGGARGGAAGPGRALSHPQDRHRLDAAAGAGRQGRREDPEGDRRAARARRRQDRRGAARAARAARARQGDRGGAATPAPSWSSCSAPPRSPTGAT